APLLLAWPASQDSLLHPLPVSWYQQAQQCSSLAGVYQRVAPAQVQRGAAALWRAAAGDDAVSVIVMPWKNLSRPNHQEIL
ncbi:MAG: hypothetical protein C0183_11460, partial [Roseiflexus castenholzii]